jgi:dTDP-4-dehydrorhamnose reductase
MTKRVLVLGIGGMLGSTCFNYFNRIEKLETFGTWRKPSQSKIKSFDALVDPISDLIDEVDPEWIVNCIGLIKQKIKHEDQNSDKHVYDLNSGFPRALADKVASSKIKVIQIATDCVYSGDKGGYLEDSIHDATDIYGKSKSLGEIYSNEFLNLRVSIIGREISSSLSLTDWFLSQEYSAKVDGFVTHKWNGITTLAYSKIVAGMIINDWFTPGVLHVIPEGEVSKFELLQLFATHFHRNDLKINPKITIPGVDRTLGTNFPELNEELWMLAGYKEIPSIKFLVNEFSNYSERRPLQKP